MRRGEGIVYVVDDERVIADTLAIILGQYGFVAKAFESPLDALSATSEGRPPDLLISDVIMPGMTGIELAIRFRETFPQCRVLLFSGKAATVDLLEDARMQGHDFELLAKPVHPADLLAKLGGETRTGRRGSVTLPGNPDSGLHRETHM